MTQSLAASPLIAKCRNGHVIRGEASPRDGIVTTTPGAGMSGGCWFICPCGAAGVIKWMTVKLTEKACNQTCMGATGPSCSCSCGGENHGNAHSFG